MCGLYAFSAQAYIETQLGVKKTDSSVTNYRVTLLCLMQKQRYFSVKRRCRSETRDPFVSSSCGLRSLPAQELAVAVKKILHMVGVMHLHF